MLQFATIKRHKLRASLNKSFFFINYTLRYFISLGIFVRYLIRKINIKTPSLTSQSNIKIFMNL